MELKLFHSMLKYNGLFVDLNISGNVIALIGVRETVGIQDTMVQAMGVAGD